MNSISLYEYITVSPSIHLLEDIWVVSSIWLLQRKLLWTFINRFINRHKFSFLLIKYLQVWLLGCVTDVRLPLQDTARFSFQSSSPTLHCLPAMYVTCSFSPSLPALGGVTIFYCAQSNRCMVASVGCGLIFPQVDSDYAFHRSTTN